MMKFTNSEIYPAFNNFLKVYATVHSPQLVLNNYGKCVHKSLFMFSSSKNYQCSETWSLKAFHILLVPIIDKIQCEYAYNSINDEKRKLARIS